MGLGAFLTLRFANGALAALVMVLASSLTMDRLAAAGRAVWAAGVYAGVGFGIAGVAIDTVVHLGHHPVADQPAQRRHQGAAIGRLVGDGHACVGRRGPHLVEQVAEADHARSGCHRRQGQRQHGVLADRERALLRGRRAQRSPAGHRGRLVQAGRVDGDLQPVPEALREPAVEDLLVPPDQPEHLRIVFGQQQRSRHQTAGRDAQVECPLRVRCGRRGHVAQGQESGHGGVGARLHRGGVWVRRHLIRSLMRDGLL